MPTRSASSALAGRAIAGRASTQARWNHLNTFIRIPPLLERSTLDLCANTTRQHWRIVIVVAAVDVAHQISFDKATSFQIELVVEKICSTNQIAKLIELSKLSSIWIARQNIVLPIGRYRNRVLIPIWCRPNIFEFKSKLAKRAKTCALPFLSSLVIGDAPTGFGCAIICAFIRLLSQTCRHGYCGRERQKQSP